MKLDSVRSLKIEFVAEELPRIVETISSLPSVAVLSRSTAGRYAFQPLPMICVGVAPGPRPKDFRLALRLDDPVLAESGAVKSLKAKVKGELDVRVVGRIYALATKPWNRCETRPLVPGLSVGHYQVTVGTLGAFVKISEGREVRMLSNNHVLANVNRGRRGDDILQQGAYDEGRRPNNISAHLESFKRISFTGVNRVDAAIATLVDGVKAEPGRMRGIGPIRGVAVEAEIIADDNSLVKKLGRTTGVTTGKVTAFELDGVRVSFGTGHTALFDSQIEIQSTTSKAFSRGGDSGSLILTPDGCAVGLLFACADSGGSNGSGLTYANPIWDVLNAFGAELLTA